MSRIFTLRGVQQSRFPTADSFQQAIYTLQMQVPKLSVSRGGILFGSVVFGKHSVASDLDVFLVYIGREVDVAHSLKELAQHIELQYNVQVSWSTMSLKIAQERPSSILSPGLFGHLKDVEKRCNSSVILGASPLVHINEAELSKISKRRELLSYLDSTKSKLLSRLLATELSDDWYDLHRSIIDKPLHIARRFLEYKRVDLGNNSIHSVTTHFLEYLAVHQPVQTNVRLVAEELFQTKLNYIKAIGDMSAYPNRSIGTITHDYLEVLRSVRMRADALTEFVYEMYKLV